MASNRPFSNPTFEFDSFSFSYYKTPASSLCPPQPSNKRQRLTNHISRSPSKGRPRTYPPSKLPLDFNSSSQSFSLYSIGSYTMKSSKDLDKDKDDEAWKSIEDREERRRVQNRNAQRRHRDRRRYEDEEKEHIATHQEVAGSAYTPARFQDVNSTNPEGLPWGAFALTSQDAGVSTTTSPFTFQETSTRNRQASLGLARQASSQGTSNRLEVPRLSSRGLASSTSVPQLRNAALTEAENSRIGLVRSKSSSNSSLKRKQEDG